MKADLKLLELAIGLAFLFKIPIQAEDQVPDRNQYNDYNFAFTSGNVAKVREFINRYPSLVTNNTWESQPPVVGAAEHGNIELVELLLTNGADVNARGILGRTALHYAAENGNAKMVEFLLQHKADVSASDENGTTPICYAIRSAEAIKLLLAAGADVNGGFRTTAFFQATANPANVGPGVMQLLLENGARLGASLNHRALFGSANDVELLLPYYMNSRDPYARSLLRESLTDAMNENRRDMVSALISGFVRFQTNSFNKAVAVGDYDAARSLLKANPAAVNGKDYFGWTPLHIAVLSKSASIVEMLLTNKANPNPVDDAGNTPLHWATYLGRGDLKRGDVVEVLLQHGATIDIKGTSENTPLAFAIERGFTSIARELVAHGADVNLSTSWGQTPLHLAASKGNVEVIQLLLAHGADVNAQMARNNQVSSPLDLAVQGDSAEAVRLLIAHGASLKTQMWTASRAETTLLHVWAGGKGDPTIADRLVAAGCKVNTQDGDGQTPLHIAINKWGLTYKLAPGRTNVNARWPADYVVIDSGNEAALWLLDHKAKVNAKNGDGQTPLHMAVTRGNLNAAKALIDHKADVNATDNSGNTPLALLEDLKMKEKTWGHGVFIDFKPVESLLLKHGAKGSFVSPKTNSPPAGF